MFRFSMVLILALLTLSGVVVVWSNSSTVFAHLDLNSVAKSDYSDVSGNAPWNYQMQNQQNTGYSPQSIINASNVDSLEKIWETGLNGLTGTPVISNGIVYLTGGGQGVENGINAIFAVNESNGNVIWTADKATIGYAIRTNSGVTVANGSVFAGTVNSYLVSINAATGKLNWAAPIAGGVVGNFTDYQGPLATPLVFDGRVILGQTVSDNGARGILRAFSENNGTLLWTYYTVPPAPMNSTNQVGYLNSNGSLSWGTNGTSGCECSGGSVWNVPAADPNTGIIYFGTAEPYPFESLTRSPDTTYCNRWANSVIALNSSTGLPIWEFQEVCDDQYDLDQGMPVQLFNTTINGVQTEVVGAGGKPGFYFELNAQTGGLIYNVTVGIHLNSYQTPPDCNCTIYPGGNGGINTFSTYDPDTNMIYTDANNQANICPTGGCINNSTLYAIDASTGSIVWNLNSSIIAGGVSSSNNLVFTTGNHTFLALNGETGSVLWNYTETNGNNTYRWQWGPPSLTDGIVFETTWGTGSLQKGTDGYLEAFAIPESLTFEETGLPSGTPWQVSFDGTVYKGTGSNITTSAVPYGEYSWSVPKTIPGTKDVRYVPTAKSGSILSPPQLTVLIPYTTQYKVKIESSNSTEGSTSPTGSFWINAGAPISVNATTSPGYKFLEWEVNSGAKISFQNANSANTTATINGSGTIKAKFGR